MTKCKKYNEKVIFFDDLEPAEQQTILKHIEECENCRTHFEKVSAILSSLKNDMDQIHVDTELLTRFVINENFPKEADFDGKTLSIYEVTIVRKHLELCNTCEARYEELINEFSSLETYLAKSEIPNLKMGRSIFAMLMNNVSSFVKTLIGRWKELLTHPKQKYIFVPATGLALLLILFLLLPLFKGSGDVYERLGKLENVEISYLTRGADITLLQSGIAEFNSGNYPASVNLLESFISERPNAANRAFAEYVCGLAYLFQVNNSLDDVKPVDREHIDKGIEHLLTVLTLSSNLRLREEANWYIGKAYLMKEEGQKALKYFEEVQNLKGKKSKKAQRILTELEKNLISTK